MYFVPWDRPGEDSSGTNCYWWQTAWAEVIFRVKHHRLINTIHLNLFTSLAQLVETLVSTNSSFQNYPHSDDHKRQTTDTPEFQSFTIHWRVVVRDVHSVLTSSNFELWTREAFTKVISRYNAKRRNMSVLTPCSSVSYTKRQHIVISCSVRSNKCNQNLNCIKHKPW